MARNAIDLPAGEMVRLVAGIRTSLRSDRELLEEFADTGNADALAALVGRYGPLVWRVCRNAMPLPADAEDAFQTTFLALARDAGRLRDHTSLPAWLHVTATRVAVTLRRSRERRQRHERLAAGSTPPRDSRGVDFDLGGILDEELSRLPERYRLPLVLCHLRGMSRTEAARELGCPEGTLKSWLSRGAEKLRRGMVRRGVLLSASQVAVLLAAATESPAVPAGLGRDTVEFVTSVLAGRLVPAIDSPVAATQLPIAKVFFGAVLACAVAAVAMVSLAEAPSAPAEPGGTTAAASRDGLPPDAEVRIGSDRFQLAEPGRHSAVAFGPRGLLISTHARDSAIVWNAQAGREVRRFEVPKESRGIVSNADGSFVVCTGASEVRAFAVDAEGQAKQLWTSDASDQLYSREIELSPNGKWVAVGGRAKAPTGTGLRLLDAATGRSIWNLPSGGSRLAFSPDNRKLAVWERDGGLVIRDAATGEGAVVLEGGTEAERVNGPLAWSPDGKYIASACLDHCVRIWDVATRKSRRFAADDNGPKDAFPGYAFVGYLEGGKVLLEAGGGQLRYWDAATGKPARESVDGPWAMSTARLSADGKQLAVALTGGLQLYDVASGRKSGAADAPVGSIQQLAFAPDGKSLATRSGSRSEVQVWSAENGQFLRKIEADPKRRHVVASDLGFASNGDGMVLAREINAADAKDLQLQLARWSATGETKRSVGPIAVGMGATFGILGRVALLDSGRTIAAAGLEGNVVLYDPTSGRAIQTLPGSDATHAMLVASARERVVAVDKFGAVRAWEPNAERKWVQIQRNSEAVLANVPTQIHLAALSPDGRHLAYGPSEKDEIAVLALFTGETVARLDVAKAPVSSLAFSADGRMLAAGVGESVRVWEVLAWQERRTFGRHRARVTSLAFSSDGRRLASGSADGTVYVWSLVRARDAAPDSVAELWLKLGGEDAVGAYAAVLKLAAEPEKIVERLGPKLRPAVPSRRIANQVNDLDSPLFQVRDAASKALAKLDPEGIRELSSVSLADASVEVRERIERAIQQSAKTGWSYERARARGIEALELSGHPDARKLAEVYRDKPPR